MTTDVVPGILDWAAGRRADLPWRLTRDPWSILVSEVMLQQTQVARVVPRYREWLARWPDAPTCAASPVAEIVRAWSGLGYNRRAVNLHRAAVVVTDRHGGTLPQDLDALLALPGVGPYTARAVLVFAFEHDEAVVDTNVARVLARAVEGRSLRPAEAQAAADRLVPSGRAWAWNQALLDLGALVCRRRAPRCAACPVADSCRWRAAGGPDPADGSAGVSGPQSRFDGSDRQGRGRLLRALTTGPVPVARVPAATGWPDDPDRARRVAEGLARDGLAVWRDGALTLPG